MKKDQHFINTLIAAFPERKTEECLSTSTKIIDYIQDDKKTEKSFFSKQEVNGFTIINKKQKTINLFSFDGCFFSSKDKKRCDGIVFDSVDLCFFELRLNVNSRRNTVRKKKYIEAIAKLEDSINYINENITISTIGLKPQAYIVMQENKYPSNSATMFEKEVAFLEKNKVQLFSKNAKVFH